jgi:hypothetical protein
MCKININGTEIEIKEAKFDINSMEKDIEDAIESCMKDEDLITIISALADK